MKASKDTVVAIHYILHADGVQAESSREGDGKPLQVLLGRGQLIPGMEKALEGYEAGDTLHVELAPEDAYGERREGMIQRVPKKYFRNGAKLKPGMTTVLALREGGQRAVVVHKVGMSTIDVDLNHPMAGKALAFDVEVVDVREATDSEREHGHVHGPGAHEH